MAEHRSPSPTPTPTKLAPVYSSDRASPLHFPLGNPTIGRSQPTPDRYSRENNFGYGRSSDDSLVRASDSPSKPNHPLLSSLRTSSPLTEREKVAERSKSPEKSSVVLQRQKSFSESIPPFQDLLETLETPLKLHHSLPVQQENTTFAETDNAEPKKDEAQGWITVFGFLRSQSESVLKEFRNIGEYMQCTWGPADSNWLHLHYKDAHSCHRALQKNGHIIGGSMIGVVPYSQFLEAHKDKLKGGGSNATSMPLRNSAKEGQSKNYKAVRPLLQQPMSVVTRDQSPIPRPQSFLATIFEYIFGF